LTDYCSSKFAAVGFDDALRMELRPQKIRHIHTLVVCPFYIDTGMFAGVRTRFPWLLPILKPETAVHRIVKAMEERKARLIMPRFVYSTYLVRLLPVRWYDAIIDFLGVTKSMDEFTGRK
jgi:all-trans-retinol dehydrogenase (NAD+)